MSEIQQGKSCGFHNAEGVRSQTAVSSLNLDSPPVDRVVLTCGQGGAVFCTPTGLAEVQWCVLVNHKG